MKTLFLILFLFNLSSIVNASQNSHISASRTLLGSGNPAGAHGYDLSMFKVVFPAGAEIPGEIHSGMQIVYVVSGALNVKILGGEAQVRRAKPDGSQGPAEILKPSSQEVIIREGDTFLEPETLVLAPRNAGKVPLVILTSSLIPTGKPQSIPITEPIYIKIKN